VLPKVNDLKELKMSLAERFDEWAKEHEQKGREEGREEGIEKGREEGIEKGIEKGEALLLQRLLVRRFGALPNEVVNQIATAASGQIETWGDRVLDAATLDEVFRP
jgi:flagellar biosynthesis/type III secretory pathway protein FliH